MSMSMNFSPQPFRGHNPRLYLLWLVNFLLVVAFTWSAVQWLGLRANNTHYHGQLDALQQQRSGLNEQVEVLLRRVQGLNIKEYNKEMDQYGAIQQAFNTDWVQLLDDLAELINEDVRIVRIQSGEATNTRELPLVLRGEARHKAAQLKFIHDLQSHASFHGVRFEVEKYDQNNNRIQFELRFAYQGDPS